MAGVEQLKALFAEKVLPPLLQTYFLETCMMTSVEDFIHNFTKDTNATEIKDVLSAKFPVKLDGPEESQRTEEQQRLLISRCRTAYAAGLALQEKATSQQTEIVDLDRPFGE